MSQNATRIQPPLDEQDFERACVVLFRGLLKDPNIERIGRRGQSQDGVDIYGLRNEDPTRPVGIQCKAKGLGKQLTDNEVRNEVRLALQFEPRLKEYFIVTTAPDDVAMQKLARVITAEQHEKGQPLRVTIWGWGNLEERISLDPEAIAAFDPGHTTHSALLLKETITIQRDQERGFRVTGEALERIETFVAKVAMVAPGGDTSSRDALEAMLDTQIDRLRDMGNEGRPAAALGLLEAMLADVGQHASGRIIFRIKANMGSCLYEMGENDRAGSLLVEAASHAPDEPKAAANKAFGLLLLGNYAELAEFGRIALAQRPDNGGVAGFIIQGRRITATVGDPLENIPASLHDDEDVVVALVDYKRSLVPATWIEAADSAIVRFPENPILRRFHAESVMERIINADLYQRTLRMTGDQRSALSAAVSTMTSVWTDRLNMDVPLRQVDGAICGNLVLGYYALDDFSTSLSIARKGHELLPDDRDIIVRGMLVALDGNDSEFADKLFPLLGDGMETAILKLRYHHGRKDWQAVAALANLTEGQIPDVEIHMLQTMVALANLRLEAADEQDAKLRELIEGAAGHARSSIALAGHALNEGFEDLAETGYRNALSLIDENSHIAARVTVATHAARIGKWSDVATLLRGHVDTSADSAELQMLANAMVNDSPIKKSAVRFFAELPDQIRTLPHYLQAAGLMHFNRGALADAEGCLRQALNDQSSADVYTWLFSTLRRAGKGQEIAPILAAIDLANLAGHPRDLMRLAHEMSEEGRDDDALTLAYETVNSNRNDPKIALAYFGLLMGNKRETQIPAVDHVGVDVWLRVEDQDGKQIDCIVTATDNRPADGLMALTHPLILAAHDRKVGDEFTMDGPVGVAKTYRIMELKHKYLHALHDVMQNFETRFPDERGLQSFSMKDDDLGSFLDQVKRMSEEHDRMLDIHIVQGAPLSMLAAFTGQSVISLADHVRRLGHDLRTCSGNVRERLAAVRLIGKNRSKGVVLDTFAVWTAATMECLDMIKAVFGEIRIAQSVIDDLYHLRDREFEVGERMSVGYHAGEHFRTMLTAEDMAESRNAFDALLAQIEAQCRIVPVEAPDEITEMATGVLSTFGTHVLDSAYLAADGCLLISEDSHYRDYAQAAVGTAGVWLQTVSEFAWQAGIIESARHHRHCLSFARRRHGYVTFDDRTIVEVIKTGDREGVSALCRYLGDANADMPSHLRLAVTVLGWLWGPNNSTPEHAGWATGMIVSALVRHRPDGWPPVLAWLHQAANQDLSVYLDRWTIGHFHNPEIVDAILANLRFKLAEERIVQLQSRPPFSLVTRGWPVRS